MMEPKGNKNHVRIKEKARSIFERDVVEKKNKQKRTERKVFWQLC